MITFSKPSEAQNLLSAKGKSFEMLITTVLFRDEAFWLNFLAEAAHTPVSILGNMLRTNLLPLKSDKDFSDKSAATSVKFFALSPTFGSSPSVLIGFPPNDIFAIFKNFSSLQR